MSGFLYKSARCFAFGAMLFFAGATDLFSVDLDNDGDVDTDAVVALHHSRLATESVSAPREDMVASFDLLVHVRIQGTSQLTEALASQDSAGPSLGSPQLLVPLRT